MNLPTLKEMASGTVWLASLSANLLKGRAKKFAVKTEASWEEEKQDILERANWLYEKVAVDNPQKLLDAMPKMLGTYYGTQWAIYSCTHLNAALRNISRLYPETKAQCLVKMEKVIDMVLTPEIRAYDTKPWREDALETLAGDKSHMTYLSLLAWVITDYKLAGGQSKRFDAYLHGCCEALNRRMLKEPDLCLLSFPRYPVFIPDMLFAIVALHNYSKLYSGMYADSVRQWMTLAKTDFLHKGTGLLLAKLRTKKTRPMSGAYTALSCYCLTQLDDECFAREQYERMKSAMYLEVKVMGTPVCGVREKLCSLPKFSFNPDAGPIVYGFSSSGTAWAVGSATYFEDWELRSKLLHTAELAGDTVKDGNRKRHYRLGELVIVGEAVALAMKTNLRKIS